MMSNTQKSEKSLSLKKEFLEWVDPLTMHGLPNIFRTKYTLMRLIWTLAFLFSNGICLYVIIQTILNYLQYEVTTKIRIIEKDSLIFPAVTICNTNPYITNESLEFIENLFQSNNMSDFANSNISYQTTSTKMNKLIYNYYFARVFAKLNSKIVNQTLFGHTFEKMFISCLYSALSCNESDWLRVYDQIYGNCYMFNSGYDSNMNKIEAKNFTQSGKYSGLLTEILLDLPNDKKTLSIVNSAHVFLHSDLMSLDSFKGLDVPIGFQSNIALKRIYRQQLPKPFSDCVENLDSVDSYSSDLYKQTFKLKQTYRQRDCLNLYIQTQNIEKCSCYDPYLYSFNHTRQCKTFKDLNCLFKVYVNLVAISYKSKIKYICPIQCDQIDYDFSFSLSNYPSESYADDLLNSDKVKNFFNNRSNVSSDELKRKLLAINVYYEDLVQTEITESPVMDLIMLVSSIGGTLGLFLGVSLLSSFEFIEIFYTILSILFQKKLNNKVNNF